MAQQDQSPLPSAEARLVFGRTLQAWCRRAGWGHELCMKWGKAAGFPSVADSTFNRLQNGKIEQPFPITFLHFGIINGRIANPLRGALGCDQLRVRRFKLPQLLEQPIVVKVADDCRSLDVVAAIVFADLLSQSLNLGGSRVGHGTGFP